MAGLPERRREQILATATALFARTGYPGTDLQVVADRLGVGKGTLYRYFPAKEDLFLAAVDRGMRLLKAGAEAEADRAKSPLDRIARATYGYLRFFHEHPEFVELILQERAEFRDRKRHTYFDHRDAGLGPWRTLLAGLIRGGRLRRIPVARIVDVLSDVLYGAIFTNYFEKKRRNPRVQADDILDVVFNGILKPRGRAHA